MGGDKEDFPGLNNWMDGGTVLCNAEGWERAVTFPSVPLAPARGLLQRLGLINADLPLVGKSIT